MEFHAEGFKTQRALTFFKVSLAYWKEFSAIKIAQPLLKRVKPYILLLAGMALAAGFWAEFAYRLWLYREYGSLPYVNHVADGYFVVMFVSAGIAIAVLLVGAYQAMRNRVMVRALMYFCSAVFALCYAVALYCVHDSHVLVTYSEFIKTLGS